MHCAFLVLAARPGRSLEDWQLALARSSRPPGLHFEPAQHAVWSDDAGRLTVGFWQGGIGSPPGERCERWATPARRFVASTGHLRWSGRPWAPEAQWAELLDARLRTVTLADVVRELRGVFTVLELGSDGTGAVASDPLGMSFVFEAATAASVVLSSRAELCARAITAPPARPARDGVAACWPAYSRHWIGLRTGFEGVRLLAPGTLTRFDPDRGAVHETDAQPWLPRADLEGCAQRDLLALAYEEIADSVRSALTLPGEARCDLTGGKDSRLVASVILGEGLADSFTFQSFGPPSLPDVQIAQELAARFGLRHEVRFEHRGSRAPYAEQARRFVAATAGMANLWNMKLPADRWPEVRVTGLSGYLLRSKGRVGPNAAGEADLVRALDAMGFGRAQLLRPETHAQLREAALAELLDRSVSGSLRDRFDAFDLRASQRHLLGLLDELQTDVRVKPFTSAAAVNIAWALGGDARFRELIHVELIRRCSDELAGYPFAGGKWRRPPPDLALLDRDVTAAEPLSKEDQLVAVLQGSSFGDRAPVLREVFEDPSNPAWELLDRGRALELLERFGSLHGWQRAELFGAATAAMWLGDP